MGKRYRPTATPVETIEPGQTEKIADETGVEEASEVETGDASEEASEVEETAADEPETREVDAKELADNVAHREARRSERYTKVSLGVHTQRLQLAREAGRDVEHCLLTIEGKPAFAIFLVDGEDRSAWIV